MPMFTATQYAASGPGASVPGAHSDNTAPESWRAIDQDGDELLDAGPTLVRPVVGYRPTIDHGRAHGPAMDSTRAGLATEHQSPGQPNLRQIEVEAQGNAFGPDLIDLVHTPETMRAAREEVAVQAIEPAPQRARAGSTGDDPARRATRPVSYLTRPFDQNASQAFNPLGRSMQGAPFASRVKQFAQPVGRPFPSPGGNTPSVGAGGGVGVATQPNTVRVLPSQWDELAINTGGPQSQGGAFDVAQQAVAQQAARGWRA